MEVTEQPEDEEDAEQPKDEEDAEQPEDEEDAEQPEDEEDAELDPVPGFNMEQAEAEFTVAQADEMAKQQAIRSPSKMRPMWRPAGCSSGRNGRRPTPSSTRSKR